MDENKYVCELSRLIATVTQTPIEIAAERIHASIAAYNKALIEERCKK